MYNSIFIDEFYQKEKNEDLIILDVREVDEFQSGHIPSAQNMPLSLLGSTFTQLKKDTLYYIICHSGGRSANACNFLSQKGFNVINVMGGMSSWKGALA
ncbi:rhodanese-like domain-containing protein [Carnobacterium gallinarum]|uniref:rhodanese-like domain-containing protein n=1 Tax=Carnobacterium gallinarum TaxID=2749 RepID=UPI000554AA90|nr:rhodanese-like domain-containing protein [Carnobacterium gallinarum]